MIVQQDSFGQCSWAAHEPPRGVASQTSSSTASSWFVNLQTNHELECCCLCCRSSGLQALCLVVNRCGRGEGSDVARLGNPDSGGKGGRREG